MAQFRTSSIGSDCSSSPRDIPSRHTPSLNEVLSFSSWNDDVDVNVNADSIFALSQTQHQHQNQEEELALPSAYSTQNGLKEDERRTNDFSTGLLTKESTPPMRILMNRDDHRAKSHMPPNDISDEEETSPDPILADFSLLSHPKDTLHGSNPHPDVPASMAEWSMPSCTGSENDDTLITPTSTPIKIQSTKQRQSQEKLQTSIQRSSNSTMVSPFGYMTESAMLGHDPSCLTASWVDLPPVTNDTIPTKPRSGSHDFSTRMNDLRDSSKMSPVLETDPNFRAKSYEKMDNTGNSRSRNVSNKHSVDSKHSNGVSKDAKAYEVVTEALNDSDAPALLTPTFDRDEIVAMNSWNDINDEHLQRPRAISRTVAPLTDIPGTTQERSSVNMWTELFKINAADRSQTRTNEKPKLKEKLMAKFSLKRDSSPTKGKTIDDTRSVHRWQYEEASASLFPRVSLDRGVGAGKLLVSTVSSGQYGLYPSLAGSEENSAESNDNIRTKLQSAWNNVKYGWTMKAPTHFSEEKPLFMLGKCYHSKIDESISHETPISSIDKFRQDFGSRLWFTYRREFPPLSGTSLTTDCGWGCMLRSGQMMLAEAFILHFLGRDWNWYRAQNAVAERHHRQIVKWFVDIPSNQCPFSLHNLVKYGARGMGKKAGDWFGPASIAQILCRAMEDAPELNPALEDICVYVASDCTLYIQDVIDLCTHRYRSKSTSVSDHESSIIDSADSDTWRAVVIMIPVRLGGETLNTIYTPCLKNMLSQDWCLGIMGGRPKHSLYFVGWQDDKLIYLDPHYCQDFININNREFPLHTYHCMSPRKLSFSRMDPSCTIGFYCKTRHDFEQFVTYTREAVSPPLQKAPYPMFIFESGRFSETKNQEIDVDGILELHSNSFIQSTNSFNTSSYRSKTRSRTSEEFVFL